MKCSASIWKRAATSRLFSAAALSRRKPVRGHKRGTVRKRYPPRQYRPCRPCKAASRECGRAILLELVRLQFPRGVVCLFRELVLQSGGRKRAALFRLSIAGVPWFQSRGQWGARDYENIAPGDAIFFDWDLDGSADHVGIVIGTDGSRIYTVEGKFRRRL